MESFKCQNCGKEVYENNLIGTKHRNHCPHCLWSLHLDKSISGDRRSICKGKMEPIGLTFKQEREDKYKKEEKGEIMIIHKCTRCGKISINRIAGDDDTRQILNIFEKGLSLKEKLGEGIIPLKKEDEEELKKQLLGEL